MAETRQGPSSSRVERPGRRLGRRLAPLGEAYGIEPQHRVRGGEARHLGVGRLRAAARQADDRPAHRGQRRGRGRCPRGAKLRREAEREAGAAGHQTEAAAGLADGVEIGIGEGVDDDEGLALGRELFGRGEDRRRARGDGVVADQADAERGLPRQHPDEVGVGHRGERVVAHARIGEELVEDEEMAAIDGAAVLRQRGDEHRRPLPGLAPQRLRHRADIALVGRIEGRAVLEIGLPRPGALEPAPGGERLRHRVGGGNRPRLQRDHHRIGVRRGRVRLGQAEDEHRPHAACGEHAGKVGRAGEVVGDGAEDQAHRSAVATLAIRAPAPLISCRSGRGR